MAGRRVENSFWKQKRAGCGRVPPCLVVKAPRVLNASGCDAKNDPQPVPCRRKATAALQRLHGGGRRVEGHRAAPAQSRVRQKRRFRGRLRNAPRGQRPFPARSLQRRGGNRRAAIQCLTQRRDIPARGRHRADAMDKHAFHEAPKISVALAPPKPNELLNTYSTFALAGCRTSGKRQAGSGVLMLIDGSHCPCSAIKQTAASTAPAAPSKWPIQALLELTGISAAASSAQRLIAAASAESLRGVPVP